MPDFYAPGEYDLAGFAVGVVERSRIVTGEEVKPGDRVLGLASSGLHSNGYSLARRVVFERLGLEVGDAFPGTGRSVADELLSPTRIYVKAMLAARPQLDDGRRDRGIPPYAETQIYVKSILALLRALPVRAMAHVTGGGITENLPRVLPEGCRAVIRPAGWPLPRVFRVIQEAAHLDEDEMLRTFNMGVGYLVVVRAEDADGARALLRGAGESVFEVGEIETGPRGVRYA